MGRHRSYHHAAAHRTAKRERGRGLRPDASYLDAIAEDDKARAWLRRTQGPDNLVERLLRERERAA